jgi:uncharacterized protein with HEPN domain
MNEKTPKLLDDIRDQARFILYITADKSLQEYSANRILRQAVERSFEIIGEAIRRLQTVDKVTANRIGYYPRIMSFRNLLIHGYDLVEHSRVWAIIEKQLPVLLHQVEDLLNQFANP